jgi:LemA protein
MNKTLLIVLGVILLIILAAVGSYNGLIGSSQAVDSSWAQVQNVYQRRADLIPNLVQTVQGAANFEKSTIVQVTEARASVGKVNINQNQAPADAAQLAEYQKAQGQLGTALSRLLVVAENYPDLKASQNFMSLQAQLEGTENRIAVARRDYIVTVQAYNTELRTIPGRWIAAILYPDAKVKQTFDIPAESQAAPQVKF